jgi:hypothetical protein
MMMMRRRKRRGKRRRIVMMTVKYLVTCDGNTKQTLLTHFHLYKTTLQFSSMQ